MRYGLAIIVCPVVLVYIVVTLIPAENGLLVGWNLSDAAHQAAPSRSGSPHLNLNCGQFPRARPGFSTVPLPRVLLMSYPGSGNTWTRLVLQMATGILTGSVYHDQYLMKHDFPGENHTSTNVLVIKTHRLQNGRPFKDGGNISGSIQLVRKCYDSLVSEFTRRSCKGHTCQMHQVNIGDLTKYMTKTVSNWIWYHTIILKDAIKSRKCDKLIVKYEYLKQDLPNELRRMLVFLHQNSARSECYTGNSTDAYKRNKHATIRLARSIVLSTERADQIVADFIDRYSRLCPNPKLL